MKTINLRCITPLAALATLLFLANDVQAQATRTWVSGVGDDANPCSRTAPCKTFAGAISKTAAGGEISVLDPGSYGSVTITKAISIVASGDYAGVLAVGTSGIIVNAGATDTVVLNGLHLNGAYDTASPTADGVRFLAGGALHVEDSTIEGFKGAFGIEFVPSGAAKLFVSNSVVSNNGNGSTGGGILIKPGVAGSAAASVLNSRLDANVFGLRVEDGGRATVVNTVASGNGWAGFTARSATTSAVLSLQSSTSAGNGTVGVRADGALGQAFVDRSLVTNNPTGLTTSAGGQLISSGNNTVIGNGADGAPTSTTPLK